MDEIQNLKNKIDELTNEINSLKRPETIPIEIVDAFIARGFLKYDTEVQYSAGVGAGTFLNMLVRYLNTTAMISFGRKPFGFVVTSTSANTCSCADSSIDMAELEASGNPIFFYTTGSLPGGLDNPVATYYIFNASGSQFQLTTDGVTAVDITSFGTGSHYFLDY